MADERERTPDRGLPVVALVSSAGGLEAMAGVLSALPAGFAAAVVALQQLQPAHPSYLAEILGRRTPLPVAEANDGDPLLAGRVLIAPPGRHVLVDAELRLRLMGAGDFPPSSPSADLLLCALATAVGNHAIAVVLSGSGHDGAIGAQAVSLLGGSVLVQRTEGGMHPQLPAAALLATAAGRSLGLAQIGPRLVRLVAEMGQPVPVR